MFLNLVSIAVIFFVTMNSSEGLSNTSYEHQLRALILDNYDKVVRPEVRGNSRIPITILFGLKLNKLAKVSIKEEIITVDTFVIMKWNNTFITWDKNKYGKVDKISFLPSEIWFPDISLINNADSTTRKAGGPTFFSSLMVVSNTGECVWSGPATFTASCSMTLNSWPFDDQICTLTFGSVVYGKHLLTIKPFETKSPKGENFEDSGNWKVSSVVKVGLQETSFGNCCPFNFSQITFSIDMGRRFEYHLFYMVAPIFSLSLLALVSFWIPSESGERIGFVTTLLLGMMVFLLIVPDSLPESSQSIPILGILMMCTMVVIALALLATIFVLRCYHSTGGPPRCFQCLMKRSKSRKTEPSEFVESPKSSQNDIKLRAVQPKVELPDETSYKSSAEDDNPWSTFSEKLDKIFFWLFFIVIVVLYGCALGVFMSSTRNV